MSVENVKNFYAKVNEDESLQQQLKELARTSAEESMQALIKLANDQGFSIDKNDLETFFAEAAKNLNPTGELNEAELEAVAGGSEAIPWVVASIFNYWLCVASGIGKAFGSSCFIEKKTPRKSIP